MRVLLILLLLNLFATICPAQTMKVIKMEHTPFDLSASTNPHLDGGKKPAALIKVQMGEKGATFENTFLLKEPIKYSGGEYMVYMAEGAKKLKIKFPKCMPIEIIFDNYGIKSLEGKNTYILQVKVEVEKIVEAPKSFFTVGAGFNVMPFMGPTVNVGFKLKKFSVEGGAVLGLSKSSEVYIYDKSSKLVDGYDYSALRGFLRLGWDIWTDSSDAFSITPQLGAAINAINGSQLSEISSSDKVLDGASAISGTVGVRFMYAPSGLQGPLRLFVTPEYDFALSKDKNFEALSAFDSKIKSWAEGFNVNLGLMFYF